MGKPVALLALLVLPLVISSVAAEDPPKRSEAEEKALARIRELGGLALELAQNDPSLEVSYHLTRDKITDEHLILLSQLKSLVHLNLRGKEVTDAQLAYLEGLTTLTRLHLEKTKITDKGLEHLKGLTNLEYLNLYGTDITDKGLEHLAGLKKLKKLYLWQTKVSDAGVAKLQKALPDLDINRGIELAKPEEKKPEAKPKEKKDKK
jgi:Leucine-rich repeat (LRR) protein